MRRSPLLLAVLMPVCVTLLVSVRSSLNRTGDRAAMWLSHREVYLGQRGADATSLTLRVSWATPPPERGWLSKERLSALGFDIGVEPGVPEAERHYARLLPRRVYVVFELDGPAWQAVLADSRRETSPGRGEFEGMTHTHTRLVPVDAGLFAETLARQYPDGARYLILAADLSLSVWKGQGRTASLDVTVRNVEPAPLHVSPELASRLPRGTPGKADILPFQVSLRQGRYWEPWVEHVAVGP